MQINTGTDMIAKPVVKNKFWIVEDEGQKIATIQAVEQGGFVYVHDSERQRFPSIKVLSSAFNLKFDSSKPAKTKETTACYSYPCQGTPHNQIWDVQRRLPLYSKTAKSRSFFCAGYYAIKYSNIWVTEYCPKNITVSRYEYAGPFKTAEEADQYAKAH